ncbi:FimD/PapC C-terminal domain-containing protein [Escherichia coli]|uniref:FimD/PapC C-terminal domain-containing protein n=1 Tax=Escherichia coli TaxID=562 RepID=UPI00398879BE
MALLGNRKNIAFYRGAVILIQIVSDKRISRYFLAQRPDGSPLSFGYEVEDESGKNVDPVGQGSRIFIRTDDVPALIRVSVNKQQEQFCTITFKNATEERQVYICCWQIF